MDKIKCCNIHANAPIPQNGQWTNAKEIKDISGFTHGVGACAPQQGACKLTLNIDKGIITEALVETIGCTGMTQSAAMASEILIGKTILEALNTDLICDAINKAMQNLFLQIVYGRSQSAFTDGGLVVGSALEDLGKHLVSAVGTSYSSTKIGARYLHTSEGYITKLGLDESGEIIGYEYVQLAAMLECIEKGEDVSKLFKTYGRFSEASKVVIAHEVE